MGGRSRSLLLLPALLPLASPARAGDPPKEPPPAPGAPAESVPDEAAKAALDRFRRDFATEDIGYRLDALKRLGRVVHPTVADLLCDLALKDPASRVRTEAFRGLAAQKTSAKTVGPRVARFLSDATEEDRKKKAKGDYGLRIDPKSGETDTDSPEGKAALRAKRERGQMLAEAVRVVDSLGYRGPDSFDSLREFLQDGNDDLVALVIGTFGKWKEWGILQPDFLQLFEMYPKETEVNLGSTSVDTGASGNADASAAKRAWMARYGDPDKRRPRPAIVKALRQAILDITGEKVETPEAFRVLLKRPEVRRKVRAGR